MTPHQMLSERLKREMYQATGKRYPELERQTKDLPAKALEDLIQFMRDIAYEMSLARSRGGER